MKPTQQQSRSAGLEKDALRKKRQAGSADWFLLTVAGNEL
jgi:hypothetical protein